MESAVVSASMFVCSAVSLWPFVRAGSSRMICVAANRSCRGDAIYRVLARLSFSALSTSTFPLSRAMRHPSGYATDGCI